MKYKVTNYNKQTTSNLQCAIDNEKKQKLFILFADWDLFIGHCL